MPTLDDEDIKRRAHQIWEREGRPEGREFQNYMDAVAELTAEDENSSDRPTQAPSGLSTNLQPGGIAPVGGAPNVGSIGTGGGQTAGNATGTARGENSE
ncbi:DUF2934 domain-containing protein [Devosia sp. 1566]|uniref:DUF2934 domain-containing protein n=1 Tax=Devosia sp. 1566 TaxID=2499144 RepID=UPI000FD8F4B8|nr:DUF2934 domain-containing protein [Devosia sp. 1566]